MIMNMERKLNSSWFTRRTQKDKYSKISTTQFWDWLVYIDDDYLSEFEVLKMKELYYQQLQELSGQAVCHLLFGFSLSFLMMGPVVRSATHGWMLRIPPTLTIATFLSVQASNWQRPNRTFHELMS